MVNFPIWIPDCDSHSPALLNSFISSHASVCSTMAFPPLGNSNHVVVSVSTDFQSNLKGDSPFHRIVYEYSCGDQDSLCNHLEDAPWEDIFKVGASAAAREFCKWIQIGTDVYIPHRKYQVKPHLHGFQLLVLLPQLIEITFFICTIKKSLLNLK